MNVIGLLTRYKNVTLGICEPCMEGKMTEAQLRKARNRWSSKFFIWMSMDLMRVKTRKRIECSSLLLLNLRFICVYNGMDMRS